LTQRKIKFILDAVKQTKTFEGLFERLIECPVALFEVPAKASGSNRVRDQEFIDEEKVRIRSATDPTNSLVLKAKIDSDEELLQWTKTKLDLRKLPTYYMMLSKFRLTMLVCMIYAFLDDEYLVIRLTFCSSLSVFAFEILKCAVKEILIAKVKFTILKKAIFF